MALSTTLLSQGLNNEVPYDNSDLNIIFKELGISTFKFPIKQDTNQLYDFIIEEYIDGKLVSEKSIIDKAKKIFEPYNIDAMQYFEPEKDSVYYHRFYLIRKDSSLSIKISTHGFSTLEEISSTTFSTFAARARWSIKKEMDSNGFININKPKDLMYLYANKDSSKEPLWCPSGLPKAEIIKRYYYVLFIKVIEFKEKNKSVATLQEQ